LCSGSVEGVLAEEVVLGWGKAQEWYGKKDECKYPLPELELAFGEGSDEDCREKDTESLCCA
jgi:hypothetical protein